MAFRVLRAGDAFWRPSNQMGVENTNLAEQLESEVLGARLWRARSPPPDAAVNALAVEAGGADDVT